MELSMPQLARVLTQDDLRRSDASARMDLSAYVDIIEQVRSGGVGGEVAREERERQRTEKRRLSIAAKQLGLQLTWRKTGDNTLRFVLSEPGGERPGGRRRHAPAAEAEQRPQGRRGRRS